MKKKNEKKEVEAVAKLAELEESLKRSQAEFANYKRRSEEEKKGIMTLAKIEVVLSMLPVYESCRRALAVSDNDQGYKMIINSFLNVLKNYDIVQIELAGNEFDPNLAEAVGFKDGKKEDNGKIAEVVEEGFMMGDQIVKPARVLIFKS